MTQQPFYPQPGYPQQYPAQQPQGYPAQPQQPYAPPAQYPGQQPQGYPGQAPMGYPQGQQAPAAPPAQAGSIDDYYNQPVAAGGPGISWKNKAEGTAYWGTISGTPTVQQDTDFNTKLPMFQKDGVTPKWVMLIPLSGVQTNHQGPAEFPDGEVVFYARGKDKEELNRAVSEAGCSGAPRVGAQFMVTLVQRKPNRTGNPTNVVQIRYVPPNGQPHGTAEQAAAPDPHPAAPGPMGVTQGVVPEQHAPQPAPAAPQAAPAPAPQPAAQQQVQQQAAPPQWAQPAAPQPQAQAPLPAGVPQAVPAQGAPAPAPAPQPPAGMTPEAQSILAGLTGQQG